MTRHQTLVDQAQDAPIPDPVWRTFISHPWTMASKKSADIRIQHPVHSLAFESGRQRVEHFVRTLPGLEPV
ncbi:hypothetical protein HNR46_003668 [Haloferula luteola]|uniref:Uncharacterized protein n=2 Tax=Haloferula luteola TaxID=595692 RepID=A0A840VL95_9BACT|nr:hypothetical protein [Haloferula luteola]